MTAYDKSATDGIEGSLEPHWDHALGNFMLHSAMATRGLEFAEQFDAAPMDAEVVEQEMHFSGGEALLDAYQQLDGSDLWLRSDLSGKPLGVAEWNVHALGFVRDGGESG